MTVLLFGLVAVVAAAGKIWVSTGYFLQLVIFSTLIKLRTALSAFLAVVLEEEGVQPTLILVGSKRKDVVYQNREKVAP